MRTRFTRKKGSFLTAKASEIARITRNENENQVIINKRDLSIPIKRQRGVDNEYSDLQMGRVPLTMSNFYPQKKDAVKIVRMSLGKFWDHSSESPGNRGTQLATKTETNFWPGQKSPKLNVSSAYQCAVLDFGNTANGPHSRPITAGSAVFNERSNRRNLE